MYECAVDEESENETHCTFIVLVFVFVNVCADIYINVTLTFVRLEIV